MQDLKGHEIQPRSQGLISPQTLGTRLHEIFKKWKLARVFFYKVSQQNAMIRYNRVTLHSGQTQKFGATSGFCCLEFCKRFWRELRARSAFDRRGVLRSLMQKHLHNQSERALYDQSFIMVNGVENKTLNVRKFI